MQLTRFLSLTDLVVLIVAGVIIFLPPRAVTAGPADRMAPEDRLALAFAEARARVAPEDGEAAAVLSKRLSDAGHLDWAVQVAAVASERASTSPSRWHSLLAASIAHADRLEVNDALDYAGQALAACAQAGDTACPSWEQVRMELYHRHLDAGVKSGIDPKKNPRAFREAGEAALRRVQAIGGGGASGGSGEGSGGSGEGSGGGSGD